MSDVLQFIWRFSLFALVHSVFAVPSLKKQFADRNRHLRHYYRLYYNGVSIVLFAWVMAVFNNSTVLYFAPGAWSLALHFMQLVFLTQLVICVYQTGIAEFLGISGVKSDGLPVSRLVTHGWYRIVRHPLYLLSLLFLLSNPVTTVRSLLLTLLSATYFIVGARLEESRLLSEFGSEYQAYRREVPFMIPRLFSMPDRV